MSGFSIIADPNNTEYRNVRIASQAYTIGDLVQQDRTSDAVDVTPATAATTTFGVYAIAMETVASTATTLLVALVNQSQRIIASVTNTPSSNHNYQRMILTDKATVNNTGTDDTTNAAVFEQIGVVDSTGKRVVGRILAVANVTA